MPKLSVVIVGETSGLKRAFAEAQGGAVALEGRFKSLASSTLRVTAGLVGLSGGLIAFGALKKSVTDAEAFDAALRSTDTAIKATGGSLSAYSATVARLADGGAKLGYTNTQILAGFKTLTLVSGNATDAVKYMALTEDIAKAKGIDLSAAATAVGKAIDGKTTALQRYGIVIAKGTPIEVALAQAQARYSGQAIANTTATQTLSATISNLEVKIGQALLPSVQHIATAIEHWVSQSKNQKKITDDVREAVKLATTAFNDIKDAIHAVDGVTGSLKNTLEALLALGVASKIAGMASGFLSLAGASGIGAADTAAAGLLTRLTALQTLGAISIPVAIVVTELLSNIDNVHNVTPAKGASGGQVYQDSSGQWHLQRDSSTRGPHRPIPLTQSQAQALTAGTVSDVVAPKLFPSLVPGSASSALKSVANPGKAFAAAAAAYAKTHPGMLPVTYGGGGGGGTHNKKGPAYKVPQELEAAIRKAQQTFKDNVTKQHLDTLVGLLRQEETLLKQHGDLAKAQSVANEITQAINKASNFVLSGTLQLAEARANALAALTSTGGGPTQLQISLAKQAKAVAMKAIDSNTLSLQGLIQAWNQVQQDNSVIASSLGFATNSYHAVSTEAITRGLGLSRATRGALEERLAQAAAHRGFAPSGPAAYGQPIIEVHLHGGLDQVVTGIEKKQRQQYGRTAARR